MVRLARFAVFFFVLACDAPTELVVCNQNLVSVDVFVMDTNGTPLENLNFRTVLTRTNRIVELDPRGVGPYGGWYPVISDLDQAVLRPGGDTLAFAAWDSTRAATAWFVVGSDRCHIFKKVGPDTIVAL